MKNACKLLLLILCSLPVSLFAQADIGTAEENRNIENELSESLNNAQVIQRGDFNSSDLDLSGIHVRATIEQVGFSHLSDISVSGDDNAVFLNQVDNRNSFILGLTGTNNTFNVSQVGSRNEIDINLADANNLNKLIQQNGNENRLNIDVTDPVDGRLVPVSVIQENGGNITINSLNQFESLLVNPNGN